MLIIIIIILILILILNCKSREHFMFYEPVEWDRQDLCKVYVDGFYNALPNTKEQVKDPFFAWCYDYRYATEYYPAYRPAEKMFLKLRRVIDKNQEYYNV